MTIVPIWKICHKCHKQYSWNPDVGQMFCPYCSGLGKKSATLLDIIVKKNKKDK